MRHTLLRGTILAAVLSLSLPATADITAGNQAFEKGDYKAAIEFFAEDLKAGDTAFEANLRTGEAYRLLAKQKKALEYLEAAEAINADDAQLQYLIGAANGELAGQASIFSAPGYAKACRKAFEHAVKLDPAHVGANRGLITYYLSAPSFLGGSKEKAALQAKELQKHNLIEGQLLEASVFMGTEQPEAAMKLYDDIIVAVPDHIQARYTRALSTYGNKQYARALEDFEYLKTQRGSEKTKNTGPERFAAYTANYYLGAVASKSKMDPDTGIRNLEEYLNDGVFDNKFREAYANYYMATLYLMKGDKKAATEHMITAKKLSSEKNLKKLLKQLKKDIKRA
ncbi:hypothetical protein KFE96_06545 [Kordiimonas sp. SCSIO 12603]|uniref:tetratricopeptide repeat protein n=1 Tax=Kordiimonas sp. SCSIO 12603 TaxID=2829596 RepID=UPI0021049EA5|nr:hypothetical protein [Kordiimonas sp. SCSIO 12603]UTW59959.1 hypothetical protein KFE96_06545 [Kordiimonas sp. SCSIO 12603]